MQRLRWYSLKQLLIDNGSQLLTILVKNYILEVGKDPKQKSVTGLASLKTFS